MNQNLQTKQDLRTMLEAMTQQFQAQGHEIIRYASLASCGLPEKIKTGAPQVKIVNLKQQEWDEYLESIKNGSYQADSYKQEPLEITRGRFSRMKAIDGR